MQSPHVSRYELLPKLSQKMVSRPSLRGKGGRTYQAMETGTRDDQLTHYPGRKARVWPFCSAMIGWP